MLRFIVRKLIYGFAVLFGVIVMVFLLFQGFGDPARLVLGQTGDAGTEANIRRELNLDQPKWRQFVFYINDLSPVSRYSVSELAKKHIHGIHWGADPLWVIKLPYLRNSYQSKRPVADILWEAFPGTLILAFAAMVFATLAGIPLGMIAAIKKRSVIDQGALFLSTVGISAPSFFTGIIIAYLFGFVWHRFTGLNITGNWLEMDDNGKNRLALQNLWLPALTLGIRPLAIITQLTRSSMLDVLLQDYIRTAKAKGLGLFKIYVHHALKNAINPVITAITGWFAELLAGAFFIEYIFGWKGVGKVTVDALEKLDFPVVMGSVLLTATFFILVNMLADFLYGFIDPRVRTSS